MHSVRCTKVSAAGHEVRFRERCRRSGRFAMERIRAVGADDPRFQPCNCRGAFCAQVPALAAAGQRSARDDQRLYLRPDDQSQLVGLGTGVRRQRDGKGRGPEAGPGAARARIPGGHPDRRGAVDRPALRGTPAVRRKRHDRQARACQRLGTVPARPCISGADRPAPCARHNGLRVCTPGDAVFRTGSENRRRDPRPDRGRSIAGRLQIPLRAR